MKVGQLMNSHPCWCSAGESLRRAAQLMANHGCGCVLVKDGRGRLVGVVTDRDICMAAYAQGLPLRTIRVSTAMSSDVISCSPDDPIALAEAQMRRHGVRRLPVVVGDGEIVGVISLHDLAVEARRESLQEHKEITFADVGETMSDICLSPSRPSAGDVERGLGSR